MISEPELVGGPAFPEPGAAPLPPPPPPPAREESASRTRRPWLWALGGAVAASAVWGGGLVAYDRYAGEEGPDLRGYRVGADPCKAGTFHGLSAAIGPRAETSEPTQLDEPALYRANCTVVLQAAPVVYQVDVTYTLHRVTDPRPEFEALMHDPFYDGGDRIDGIGDTAFVNDGANAADGMVINVIDGPADLRISLSPSMEYDENGNPRAEPPKLDPAALRTYLVEDTKQMMTALRKK
ncbi:hypothetical protein [Streptomyces fradiae]|uniref:hypothetical protein n=1 Tax=Streptomyces fradiae TaxID=1906 RepID=UPI003518A43C